MNTKLSYIIIASILLTITGCTTKSATNSQSTQSPQATAVQTSTPTEAPTASPSATPKPTKSAGPKSTTQALVDCTGPDGKVIKLTQKACTDFNSAWNKSSATATPAAATQVTGCAAYNPTGPLGTIRVTIKLESGQSWQGQGTLKVSQKYTECRGNGLDYVWADVINSTLTRDFGGLRPGPYKVEVTYNNKPWSTDVNLNGGVNDVTVTISNN